ncbi:MAG: amidohydrolase [Lachnospiraceae bacterium]|nr:amidohydrolase [Lachnospiraceae bacterium]
MDKTEQIIINLIDEHRKEIISFAKDIFSHAELGYKEFYASSRFAGALKEKLSHVDEGLAITGVKGYLNEEKKDNFSLALIGELDALRIPEYKYANPETGGAHCCGHHAQLAGVFGAFLALADDRVKEELGGEVIFFATPAEEYGEAEFKNSLMKEGKIRYGGGKCELIRIGAFDDVDAAVAHHISTTGLSVGSGTGNGFVAKVIKVEGRASHAAAAPEKGINALEAATLGLQALAYYNKTFRDEDSVRVHPILTKGGDLVNVIPQEAVIETLVRGKTIEAFTDAANKTDLSFKGGALALGAGYRIETSPGYLPTLPQSFPDELIDLVREAANEEPRIVSEKEHSGGSTDVGDVQHLLPVYTFNTGGAKGGLHQTDFEITDEDKAYLLTAKIFALSAYRLLKDDAKLGRELRKQYKPVFKNKDEYTAFLEQFRKVEEKKPGEERL